MDQSIGERLAIARRHRKKSQDKLARELDLATATVSRYETGSITLSVEKARAFADHLGISLDWLLAGVGVGPEDRAHPCASTAPGHADPDQPVRTEA